MRSFKTMAAMSRELGRRGSVRRLLLAFCAAGVVAACGASGHAQQPPTTEGVPTGSNLGYPLPSGPFTSSDEMDSVEAERRLNALNAERQKSLTADAERLLKLASELNQEIAQSNTGSLTPAQLRVVAEIEKLAHNVRDKMAMSLRGPQFPAFGAPIQPFPQSQHR